MKSAPPFLRECAHSQAQVGRSTDFERLHRAACTATAALIPEHKTSNFVRQAGWLTPTRPQPRPLTPNPKITFAFAHRTVYVPPAKNLHPRRVEHRYMWTKKVQLWSRL